MAIPVVLIAFLACISTILTPLCTADSIMYPGNRLLVGQSMTTGTYALRMQKDCNLVLYDNHRLIWQTGTGGKGSDCYATLSEYCEFVINDKMDKRIWIANTKLGTVTSCVLILQRDRNIVIYRGLWDARTNVRPGTRMGIRNGGDDFHRASVLVNSEGELELGSMITQVVNE